MKKTRAGRSSSVHATQKEAEKRAKELSIIWEEAKSVSRAEVALSGIPTQWDAVMIRTHRLIAATDVYLRTVTLLSGTARMFAEARIC